MTKQANTLSRRAVIAGTATTAAALAGVPAIAEDGQAHGADTDLLALAEPWQQILDKQRRWDEAPGAEDPGELTVNAIDAERMRIEAAIAALPATTWAGLQFKAQVASAGAELWMPSVIACDVLASLLGDLGAMPASAA